MDEYSIDLCRRMLGLEMDDRNRIKILLRLGEETMKLAKRSGLSSDCRSAIDAFTMARSIISKHEAASYIEGPGIKSLQVDQKEVQRTRSEQVRIDRYIANCSRMQAKIEPELCVDHLREAVASLERALDQLGSNPAEKSEVMADLAECYSDLGLAAANEQEAVSCCQKSVSFYEGALHELFEEGNQERIAYLQSGLSMVYRRLAGIAEAEANLELAAKARRKALLLHDPTEQPFPHAADQIALGIIYLMLSEETDVPLQHRSESCSNSIAAFKAALDVAVLPADQEAVVKNNLGIAYTSLCRILAAEGRQAEASKCLNDGLGFLLEAERIRGEIGSGLASIQNNLGNAYMAMYQMIEEGGSSQDDLFYGINSAPFVLCRAIASYDQAGRACSSETDERMHGLIASNLGMAYLRLAENLEGAKGDERADSSFAEMEAGIKEISKCVALPDHHGIEKAEDEILGLQSLTIEDICRKAASSLREAVRSLQEGSTDWAKAEAELGYACLLLAGFAEEAAAPSKDQRTPGGLIASQYDLMKEAAAAYQAALQVFTIERDRTFFGELHKDLAVVYSMIASDSIKPDSEAMEMFAVSSCQQALKIYSSTDHPLEHAEIQNMLGLALGAVLRHHIGADRLMLALAASAAFREAGRIMLQHCQLEEHAQARSRLAQSLMILSVIEEDEGASMTAREKTLNEAVLAISDAAGIFSPNVHLAEYASLMRRLGMAYRSLTQLYSLMIEEAETDGLSDKDVAKKESKEKALEGNRLELTQDRRTNTNKKVKMDFKTDSESDRKKTRADARIAANEAERKGQRRRDVLKLRDVRQDYCKQAIRSYKKAIRSFNEAIDRLPQSDAERDELKAMVKDCLFGAESCRSIMRGIKG